MPFLHHITPRLYDTDCAGVVFYGSTYRFCQAALEELLAQIYEVPLHLAMADGRLCSPVVHSAADYAHPLRLGERCEVRLHVGSMSAHSITYKYTIHRADGTLCASLCTRHVFCDPTSGRPVAAPAPLLAGLRRLGLLPT